MHAPCTQPLHCVLITKQIYNRLTSTITKSHLERSETDDEDGCILARDAVYYGGNFFPTFRGKFISPPTIIFLPFRREQKVPLTFQHILRPTKKTAVCWHVTPCSMVGNFFSTFRGKFPPPLPSCFYPSGGSRKFL